jgi:predicted dehydrogenase
MTASSATRVRVAVAGLGYWGPNLARNFASLPGCELVAICDADPNRLAAVRSTLPEARGMTDFGAMLDDSTIDAVALATPVATHASLAVRVLSADKHCFVEKPLATTVSEAASVVAAAQEVGRILMVGHLLEYHPGVRMLQHLVADGQLGDPLYIYGNRLNLGKVRTDENALWSLGAHDVSVVLAVAGEEPDEVVARGECYLRPGVEDVVFCYLRFPSGLAAHLHLSWLDPHKERRFTVVGRRRMATFDDMALEGKVTVYDKGFDEDVESWGEYITRTGDIWCPRIPNSEPLRIECEHFADCIRSGATPRSDGTSGLRVVRVLEMLQRSLERSAGMAAQREYGKTNGSRATDAG